MALKLMVLKLNSPSVVVNRATNGYHRSMFSIARRYMSRHEKLTSFPLQFPFLCSYNNATYKVVLQDKCTGEVRTHGPYHMHWMGSGSQVRMDIRRPVLHSNTHYTGNITVATLAGKIHTSFQFSE